MCGIAGYAGFDDAVLLRRMCRSLTHRGPDDEGFYRGDNVGLSMRRLSVIDLRTGHQPIPNEARDVWVVFNGEIYNHDTLRRDLQAKGHVFGTSSDTETIVHLYEEFGLDCVSYLRGMFAIALWDERRQRLMLARDRIGEKPLFYASDGARVLFGSEIKAILQHPWRREADPQAVCDFLAMGYVTAPRTFYQGISKLAPGEMLVHERGITTIRRYWTRRAVSSPMTEDAAALELADRLTDVVKLCLKSDVEVGAFLSGGIDSSILVALMRKQAAHVKTFSVGYAGKAAGFNELSHARFVADHVGSEHHELTLGAHSSVDLLPKILWHFDEPHGEPTSVLVYQLCQFTRERVKVAVGGTGGDEIFFGYPRHLGIRLLQYYRFLPAVVRNQVIERIVDRWPESTRGSRFAKRVKRFVQGAHATPDDAYLSWMNLIHPDVRSQLLSTQVRNAAEHPMGDAVLRRHLIGEGSIFDRATSLDVEAYLPEYQLTYMDRMSMAHGLEVRSPFCDYDLVEWVTSLPVNYRLKGLTSKHLLKRVSGAWLPREIAARPKVGFDSPIGQWFKDELSGFLSEFMRPETLAATGLLNPTAVANVIGDHRAGRRDYSLQLWTLLALEGWHRMYIRDNVTEAADAERYRFTEEQEQWQVPA